MLLLCGSTSKVLVATANAIARVHWHAAMSSSFIELYAVLHVLMPTARGCPMIFAVLFIIIMLALNYLFLFDEFECLALDMCGKLVGVDHRHVILGRPQ